MATYIGLSRFSPEPSGDPEEFEELADEQEEEEEDEDEEKEEDKEEQEEEEEEEEDEDEEEDGEGDVSGNKTQAHVQRKPHPGALPLTSFWTSFSLRNRSAPGSFLTLIASITAEEIKCFCEEKGATVQIESLQERSRIHQGPPDGGDNVSLAV